MFVIKNKIGAIFQLTVRKVGTEEVVQQTPKFQNIVLNSGLEMMGTGIWVQGCFVGTGSSEPNATQTTLDNPIAMSNSQNGWNDASNRLTKPYYAAIVVTYRFNAGVAQGNLTEVALGTRTGSGTESKPFSWNCWNRALIKDVNGKPTTLTILEDEFLDVTAEIRIYPSEKVTGGFRFLNKLGEVKSEHTYVGYPYIGNIQASFNKWSLHTSIDTYSGVVDNDVLADPSKTINGARQGRGTPANPVLATPTRVVTDAVFALNTGNVEHNGFLALYSGVLSSAGNIGYKFIIDPPLKKTNQEEHTWKTFIEWGRYEGEL